MDQAGERRTGFKDEHDGSGDRGGTQDQSNDRGRMWRHEQAVADEQDREPQGYDRNDGLCDYSIATLKLLERLQTDILGLTPSNDTQRWLQAQSLQTSAALLAARWQLSQNSANTPKQLLLLVMFWFTIIFASFGMFAPRNTVAIVAILLCSIGVGSAVRVITELQNPFDGLIRLSSTPLIAASAAINR